MHAQTLTECTTGSEYVRLWAMWDTPLEPSPTPAIRRWQLGWQLDPFVLHTVPTRLVKSHHRTYSSPGHECTYVYMGGGGGGGGAKGTCVCAYCIYKRIKYQVCGRMCVCEVRVCVLV